MSLAGLLPDPTNQGKDNQGRVEDEEKDVQEGIHQWGIAVRLTALSSSAVAGQWSEGLSGGGPLRFLYHLTYQRIR